MRTVIKITILSCLLVFGLAEDSSNYTATCTSYDSTTNASQQAVQNGTQVQNVFAQCPPGLVPGPVDDNNTNNGNNGNNAKSSSPIAKDTPPPPPNNTNPQPNPQPNNTMPNNTNPMPNQQNNTMPNNTNPMPNPQPNNTNPQNNSMPNNTNPQPTPQPPVNKTRKMGCIPPIENNGKCQNGMMCKSKICILGVCSPPANNGNCQSESDTLDGYFCKKGTVTKCYQMNETCYGDSIMECYHGACNKATMKCDTFVNAVRNDSSKPALIGGDSTGFKTCTVATVDTDCVYKVGNATKTASELRFQCMATKYAPTVQYFCQMGGGEPTFLEMAKAVRFTFLISLVGCKS
jgi:hypothetical protein